MLTWIITDLKHVYKIKCTSVYKDKDGKMFTNKSINELIIYIISSYNQFLITTILCNYSDYH